MRVALTFDDGPNPNNTGELLDVLAHAGARATFFLIGSKLEEPARAALAGRMALEGHEPANHSYSHDPDVLRDELRAFHDIGRANGAIRHATGVTPRLFRPPFGKRLRRLARAAKVHDLRTIVWSVDTRDWRDDDADVVADRLLRGVRPGAIVLLHDGGPRRRGVVEGTARAVPELVRRGYGLVTVSELLRAA